MGMGMGLMVRDQVPFLAPVYVFQGELFEEHRGVLIKDFLPLGDTVNQSKSGEKLGTPYIK